MDTYLAPIENPSNPFIKLAYAMARRQFGKVLTPIKVVYSRMPVAFGMFMGKIGKLDKKLTLPFELQMLVRERVARINVCLFCIDIGRSFIIKSQMDEGKFHALDDYATSPLFSDAERAVLDYATELTRDKSVHQSTFQRMARYFTERQICEIVWLISTEHMYNITNIGLNIHSDMLCDLAMKKSA